MALKTCGAGQGFRSSRQTFGCGTLAPMTVRLRTALACLALAAVTAGCGGSGAVGSPAVPPVSVGPDTPRIAAKDLKFDRTELQMPANAAFALFFDNQEALPHNVSLTDASGAVAFVGEVFTGPSSRVYAVPPLKPGAYTFKCDLHPDMKGTATAH
jgi:plastocyanin